VSISELARADIATSGAADCDSATLTAPASLDSAVYVVPCQFVRRGQSLDAEGLAVIADSASLSVALVALAFVGIADPEVLKQKGWTALVNGVLYRLDACPIDYTIGQATITLKRSAA